MDSKLRTSTLSKAAAVLLSLVCAAPSEAVFLYKRTLTVDHTKVPSTQTNFTVLVSSGTAYSASLATVPNGGRAQDANGYDIGFYTASDCTGKMSWETELYSATTGIAYYWVNVASLSSSVDTVFYLCYSNSEISSSQSTTAAWDSSFKGVWHLIDGSSLSAADSTSNTNTGTITAATAVAGKVDGGASFNGTTGFIRTTNNVALGDFTISFWAKVNGTSNSGAFFGKVDDGGNGIVEMFANSDQNAGASANNTFLGIRNDGAAAVNLGSYSSSTPYDNTFHYHTLTRTGTTVAVYLDGVSQTITYSAQTLTSASISSTEPIDLGARNARNVEDLFFSGSLDEFHLSTTLRSADWITTEYNNQSNPTAFMTVGAETQLYYPRRQVIITE